MTNMPEIQVEWSESMGECDHAGCSGPEIITITATQKGREPVSVEYQSCFGVDRADLIKELLMEWEKEAAKAHLKMLRGE